MDIDCSGFKLIEIDKFNIILGKNGCGKSFLLKAIDAQIVNNGFSKVRYISPQRGGYLRYEPNIEQNLANSPGWLEQVRRNNQSENFKQQSTTLFRQLEILFLRELETDHVKPGYMPRNFDETVNRINSLLDRVKIERDASKVFRIVVKATGLDAPPDQISSGESELISLAIEILTFSYDTRPGTNNILLMDEPDVHLHPDLQERLAQFIIAALTDKPVILIIATHSTALVAGLGSDRSTRIAFMRQGDTELRFRVVSDVDRQLLPMFGAHPLSNVFNNTPALLIEGEDDARVWQQAVRSAGGKLKVFPCIVDGIPNFSEFEVEVNNILQSVYDNAQAFSIRDRDKTPEEIDDLGSIVRARLACRAAENLMLCDEVLRSSGIEWTELKSRILSWIESNSSHPYYNDMVLFADEGFDRKNHDIKTIRNITLGLFSNKPWEVLVGQSIARLANNDRPLTLSDASLQAFLGAKICTALLKKDLV